MIGALIGWFEVFLLFLHLAYIGLLVLGVGLIIGRIAILEARLTNRKEDQ